ncbi:chemotaxis protein [Nitratidesulfovibrio liaohensis]|uniref:Chemotaxis protein n=1 Tax=Nitratidesulfovibrio liaohensis TaxID=2604158 RepID=A0ABY9R0Y3_9BACT|nr:chemotaxis protein [Nitratidesulfovibrio liaohensis]WMW64981.1 chemotaxis protein [Nitratidesulfovibrio liaohensis]
MGQTGILLESGTNELEIVEFFVDEAAPDGVAAGVLDGSGTVVADAGACVAETPAGGGFGAAAPLACGSLRRRYGVNVAKVVEIIRMQPITALPQMPHPAVLGAFPHRDGRVIPLVDLAKYLGIRRDTSGEPKIIVTEFNTVITGFLVSGVNRIHRISWIDVEAPGRFLQEASRNSITGMVRLDERVVFLLDMESIVAEMHPDLSIRMERPSGPASAGGQGRGAENAAGAAMEAVPPDAQPDLPPRRYRILHADDSGSVRRLVRSLMEASGRFELLQANDGQEAWEMLDGLRREAEAKGAPLSDLVQAVVSDIEMPRMDGLTLCRRIKEDPALRALPVALFSSLVSERLGHKGESVGADAQFAKPDLQMLSQKVLELLGDPV